MLRRATVAAISRSTQALSLQPPLLSWQLSRHLYHHHQHRRTGCRTSSQSTSTALLTPFSQSLSSPSSTLLLTSSSSPRLTSASLATITTHAINAEQAGDSRPSGGVSVVEGATTAATVATDTDTSLRGVTAHDVIDVKAHALGGEHVVCLTVSQDATVSHAVDLMIERGAGCIVVCDEDGNHIGIVSERDVLSKIIASGRLPQKTRVGAIMSPYGLVGVHSNESVLTCMTVMVTHHFRHLPILDRTTGSVIGVLSMSDIIRVLLREYRHQIDHLRSFIDGRGYSVETMGMHATADGGGRRVNVAEDENTDVWRSDSDLLDRFDEDVDMQLTQSHKLKRRHCHKDDDSDSHHLASLSTPATRVVSTSTTPTTATTTTVTAAKRQRE